jgi:hypothetical protein
MTLHAATLGRFGDVADAVVGVHLDTFAPFTTLIVHTTYSVYRVVIGRGPEVYVQGGAFFPNPTAAYVEGASIGAACLKVGWIGVGLLMEIRVGDQRIVTSPVHAIRTG